MSYAQNEMKVLQWGADRGIVQNGKPVGQARKTLEEAGELLEATAKWKMVQDMEKMFPELEMNAPFAAHKASVLAEAKDAVGDVVVTLIMACATLDIDLVECLAGAYDEIKDRKGFLNAQGIFVKEVAK